VEELRVENERARAVMAHLDIPLNDARMLRQVRKFIACNGYIDVLNAAEITKEEAQRITINSKWGHTIGVYNKNFARLSYLYTLTHWVESGLRSQVDIYYTRHFGIMWHLHPDKYIYPNSVALFRDMSKSGIIAQQDKNGRIEITEPTTAHKFLSRLTLGILSSMVLYLHIGTRGAGVLVDSRGNKTSRQDVRSALKDAKNARNAVAHNRTMHPKEFDEYNNKLLKLLHLMGFDVAQAIDRAEEARNVIIADQKGAVGVTAFHQSPVINGHHRHRRRRGGRDRN